MSWQRLMHLLPRIALGVAVATTLGVSLALTVDVHPNGDDFCVANEARDLGFLGCVTNGYAIQGGRWAAYIAACGADSLVELHRGYPWWVLGIWLLAPICIGFLFGSIPGLREDRRLVAMLTALFLALYWAGMPFPGENVYFLDGAWVYAFNLFLGLVLVGMLLRLPLALSARHAPAIAGMALLALALTAFHELFGLVLGLVLLVGAGLTWRPGDRRWVAWVACGAAVGVALVSVVVAPGNEVRARGAQPVDHSVVGAIFTMIRMVVRVLDVPVLRGDAPGGHGSPLGWVADPKLLAATVLFAASPRIARLRPAWLVRDHHLWRLLAPGVAAAALLGCLLAGGWALGRTLPLRIFDALYLFFLLGWFLTVFVYTRSEEPADPARPPIPLLRFGSALVLALGLMVATPTKHGLRDLADGRTRAYDREMTRRYAAARELQLAGGGELVARRIEPWPSSYYVNDIREDPEDTRNACLARYLEVESTRLEAKKD